MAHLSTPRLSTLAERAYALLLWTYPADFRRAYGHEMLQTFRHAAREALLTNGNRGLLNLSALTFSDLLTTALREHTRILSQRVKFWVDRSALFLSPMEMSALAWAGPARLQIAQDTDIGSKRLLNEDSVISVLPQHPATLQEKGALFVVADGMGGHGNGDRASTLTVNAVRDNYYQSKTSDTVQALSHALKHANALVYAENVAQAGEEQARKGMGSTCIAAVLQAQTLTVANVGDSRAYIIHADLLRQVSRDHSIVAQMVQAGEITPEQARTHEKRNVIYRALGTFPEVEVDTFVETVEPGDILLLCTDGLTGLLPDSEILQIIQTSAPDQAVPRLIASANAAGGDDNISVIVVRVD